MSDSLPPLRPALAAALVFALRLASPSPAATIVVNTDQDSEVADAFCSLREAIVAANTDAAYAGCASGWGADRIAFALPTPATILLLSNLPSLSGTLKLQGPGADLLTIDGQDLWQIIRAPNVGPAIWLGFEELTLAHGSAAYGAAISAEVGRSLFARRVRFLANVATNGGGAVDLQASATQPATATFVECELADNEAWGPTGAGALNLAGPGLTGIVTATTFSGNRAAHVNGVAGAIFLKEAALTLERSTFSHNSASSNGGAILARATTGPSVLTLRDVTIVGNQADADGSGAGDGGGIATQTASGNTLTIAARNSLLAANEDPTGPAAPDLFLPAVHSIIWQSEGFNVIGSVAGAESYLQAGAPNPEGDRVGTAAAPIDPRLEPLADHGGFAPTLRPILEATSPLIDQGSCPTATGDQRGGAGGLGGGRIADLASVPDGAGDGCDVGAFERLLVPRAESPVFSDAFEVGHLLLWSGEAP
ncbi:MAG: CSLREA domain-containing protein [Holophagales bacterium]|nr:MAG: CSLREA domain-containing protein [Holophagales bacterium]